MKRCLVAFVAVLGLSSAAGAATIIMVPDQPVYLLGDTVTIIFTADGQGAGASSLYARFSYDPTILVAVPPTVPPQPIPFTPNGVIECRDGSCEVLDQLTGPFPPSVFIATVSFLAVAPGTTQLEWEELDFFGLTSAPGATVTVIPEPATAALLALGFVALGAARRARS